VIVVPIFFLISARLRRNLARWRYQDSNDPARPESAIQLWVDGRIIHVASHRRGPVVNLSHLHNRVLTAPMLSRIRANRKIRLSAVVSSHASRANANAFGNEGFRVGTSIDTYHYRSSINRNKIRACNGIFCILGTLKRIFSFS